MSLYGQGSFLRMFILEQVVQPSGARSVEGEGYIRLQARDGVQQIPSKYRRSMVVSSEQERGQEGVRAQAKESRSSTTRGPSGFFVVGDGGDGVVAAGVVG